MLSLWSRSSYTEMGRYKEVFKVPVANGIQSEYMVLDRELHPSEPLSFPKLLLS